MKSKIHLVINLFLLTILLTGCYSKNTSVKNDIKKDDLRVVSLYSSYTECWILSGGSVIGVTQDAFDERDLKLSDDVTVVGTVKDPNIEKIASLNPDYVILSKDITADIALEDNLKQLGISYDYFEINTFEDYANMMKKFCDLNNNPTAYKTNVSEVADRIKKIKNIIKNADENASPNVLLLRAYSTGVKAKGSDNTAGYILDDLGCKNLTDTYPSLLEDLSIESIVTNDPDYIFVTTMGDEDAALSYINDNLSSNPAWSKLKAINNNHYYVLPKELFHYKPNNRWADSYEYIAKIIYPDLF